MFQDSKAVQRAPVAVRSRPLFVDLLVAVVLSAVLTTSWSIMDWSKVGRLILPDADDMMRLAQVRDWLNGQAFNDWTQYRMAPPSGAPMHWSRINDFGIAAIILAATPFAGRHIAEIIAVIGYPAILFACDIFLSARIARRLWSSDAGLVAAVLAALAYPGVTLFIPGRIDHHALQTVVIEIIILMSMRRSTMGNGAVAGTATAVSLMIGLETVPQVAGLIGAMAMVWVVRGKSERRRMLAFAYALGGCTLVFLATMRPTYWSPKLCDAFTPASSTGMLATAVAIGLLAMATPALHGWRSRLGLGCVVGIAAIGFTLCLFPACLHGPYGVMNPFLRQAFLPHIDEANGIFTQRSTWRALSLSSLMVFALIVSAWTIADRPKSWFKMLPSVTVVAISAIVTLAQVRGTYIGAPASAPILAGMILAARKALRWRFAAIIGAWLASAGIAVAALPGIALRLAHPGIAIQTPTTPQILCNGGDTWAMVDRYPPGIVMAPTNMASYMIGATHMSTVGAGYHRNDLGNMAMYRYFLNPPQRSSSIARAWNVTYVAFCPGDFEEIHVTHAFPNSLATMLQNDRPPRNFRRLPLPGSRLRFYRIER